MFYFLLLSFVPRLLAWQKYEETLVEPGEVVDNKHEFILDIEPKLTMSIERDFRKLSVLDYDIDNQVWFERVENQLKPCLETIPLSNGTEPADENVSDLIQLHGLHARISAINGQFPGKPLVVMYGTEIVVRVRNHQLLNSLSVRIHGLDNEWYQDGEAYLQQCPIPVKSEFVYRFKANRQGTMILRAAFPFYNPVSFSAIVVVKKRNERLALVQGPSVDLHLEYMLSVIDWPFVQANQQHIENPVWTNTKDGYDFSERDTRIQQPHALIINGKGWHSQEDILKRPSKIPLATFRTRSGQNTLFRIAHLGFESGVRIHIEDHDSILAVADGTHTIPRLIDSIVFYPGERYNFHFQGKANPTKKIYRIVFQTVEKFPGYDGTWKPVFALANLEYDDVELGQQNLDEVDWNQVDCTESSPCLMANCQGSISGDSYSTCIDAGDIGFPDPHNETGMLKARVYSESELEEHFISMNRITKVDGFSYKPPDRIPFHNKDFKSCEQTLCNRENVAEGEECPCFYYKKFELGKIIQLVIYNMGPTVEGKPGREIPFHLHSTHFFLVKWAGPVYHSNGTLKMFNPDLVFEDPEDGYFDGRWRDPSWSQGNIRDMSPSPGLRDTVIIPYGGYIVLRFRASQAGWFMAESMRSSEREAGLAFAFKVGNEDQMNRPPPDFPNDCGHFEAPPLSLLDRETIYRTLNM